MSRFCNINTQSFSLKVSGYSEYNSILVSVFRNRAFGGLKKLLIGDFRDFFSLCQIQNPIFTLKIDFEILGIKAYFSST